MLFFSPSVLWNRVIFTPFYWNPALAAFRRTVGAPGQRSTSKRGFSKACQQAIPTGAKGGVGRRNLHTRPIGLFSDPGKCLLQGFGGLRATDTCSVLVTGLCLGPQRTTHWPDGPPRGPLGSQTGQSTLSQACEVCGRWRALLCRKRARPSASHKGVFWRWLWLGAGFLSLNVLVLCA